MQDRSLHDEPIREQGLNGALPLDREGGARQHLTGTFFQEAPHDASRHDLLTE